ncbi:DUF551 domain-containing protein [Enterobacter hormaechei]|uniref:DUF551 domain-containing protein n=1 Tax=Enterobacter hormaechei TaxID=158836 RepID=UPI0012566FC5|nr:DUF551 domain-containing protein [Enterobacter hormaechei]VAC63427.1 Protein of uncharacterised function (DUF551) [Enterobacter hormaechei]
MSTITRELAKLFRKITNSEIDAEGNAHVVLSPADSLLINNARIALASLEAEPVCVIDQSNLDYLNSGSDADVWPSSRTEMGDVLLYRSATPAPVSVPAAMEMDDDFDSAFEHGKAVGWNAYRAAMLQSFGNSEQLNSPVIPDGLRLALSNAGIAAPESDEMMAATCEKHIQALVTWVKERKPFRSAVIPDGWVACSERMPEAGDDMIVFTDDIVMSGVSYSKKKGFYLQALGYDDDEPVDNVTHWMPLPAAPQQEVK